MQETRNKANLRPPRGIALRIEAAKRAVVASSELLKAEISAEKDDKEDVKPWRVDIRASIDTEIKQLEHSSRAESAPRSALESQQADVAALRRQRILQATTVESKLDSMRTERHQL